MNTKELNVVDFDKEELYESMEFFDIPKKSLKQRVLVKLMYLLCAFLICSLIISIVVSFTVGYIFICDSSTSTNTIFDPHLKNTTEMQIDLKDFDTWIDRDAKMDEWIKTMNKHSNYLDTTNADIFETTRKQYEIDASNCNSDIEYRVREYTSWKDGDSMVTMDSKVNDKDINIACTAPIAPGPSHYTTSSEKCELDLHECSKDDKYSREARIYFTKDTYELPTQCIDMVDLYPEQFTGLDEEHLQKKVSTKHNASWYERKYSGYMDDTKYEIAFTLRYKNLEDARNGDVKPTSGEWSIRLFTVGDGYSDTWNTSISDDILDLYKTLKQTFGEDGCN